MVVEVGLPTMAMMETRRALLPAGGGTMLTKHVGALQLCLQTTTTAPQAAPTPATTMTTTTTTILQPSLAPTKMQSITPECTTATAAAVTSPLHLRISTSQVLLLPLLLGPPLSLSGSSMAHLMGRTRLRSLGGHRLGGVRGTTRP
jgi:hypothetical protein